MHGSKKGAAAALSSSLCESARAPSNAGVLSAALTSHDKLLTQHDKLSDSACHAYGMTQSQCATMFHRLCLCLSQTRTDAVSAALHT